MIAVDPVGDVIISSPIGRQTQLLTRKVPPAKLVRALQDIGISGIPVSSAGGR